MREIVSFREDDEGDPIAVLECGHGQHVRHDPPMVFRPWVESDEGRREHIGDELDCVKCDRDEPSEYDVNRPD
jgi:hypothetical protein